VATKDRGNMYLSNKTSDNKRQNNNEEVGNDKRPRQGDTQCNLRHLPNIVPYISHRILPSSHYITLGHVFKSMKSFNEVIFLNIKNDSKFRNLTKVQGKLF
jgi:hypothetical protein